MKLVAARCPNCGANIDVDKDSDSTKCEYCKSKIIVEDAIKKVKVEMSGSVEVSNSTNISKLLKIANQYYFDKEYKDALRYYEKALELNPDEPLVVFRVGMCSFLVNSTNTVDTNKPLKALKNAYKLLNEDLEKNKRIINSYITETYSIIDIVSFKINNESYNVNCSFNDLQNLLATNRELLGFYIYCYSIVVDDNKILDNIYFKIKNLINIMLTPKSYLSTTGTHSVSKIGKEYKDNLLSIYEKYFNEYKDRHPELDVKNDMVVSTTISNSTSYVGGIVLCSIMCLSAYVQEYYLSSLFFLFAVVLFINPIYKKLWDSSAFRTGLIIFRIIAILLGIVFFNTYY